MSRYETMSSEEGDELSNGHVASVEVRENDVITSWQSRQEVRESIRNIGQIVARGSKVEIYHDLRRSSLHLPHLAFVPRVSRLKYIELIKIDVEDLHAVSWRQPRFMGLPPHMLGVSFDLLPEPEMTITTSSLEHSVHLLNQLSQSGVAEELPAAYQKVIEGGSSELT